ncbi:MAG: hypothetical protein O3B04_01885 [Chloroflexi bacterium]|nr:hypothetical protein [Chloroflexota bacterium]
MSSVNLKPNESATVPIKLRGTGTVHLIVHSDHEVDMLVVDSEGMADIAFDRKVKPIAGELNTGFLSTGLISTGQTEAFLVLQNKNQTEVEVEYEIWSVQPS